MKRYVVEFQQYMWAEDDDAIIKEAKKFADNIGALSDNGCSVRMITEQQFGSMKNRKINLTKNQK